VLALLVSMFGRDFIGERRARSISAGADCTPDYPNVNRGAVSDAKCSPRS